MTPLIWSAVLRLLLAAVMLGAALSKLAGPASSRRALATYGVHGEVRQTIGLALIVASELAIAAGLAAGWEPAAVAGLALATTGAGLTALLLSRGREGAPCPCFGARSRVGRAGLIRDLVLAAGMVAVIAAPTYQPTRDEWFAIGLAAALLLCLALAAAVAALAREVGMLRMRVGPSAALEIPEEGPPLGARSTIADQFDGGDAELRLAVFMSPGCRVCESLRPAVESIRGTERIAIRVFDEQQDLIAWEQAEIPGSPYAVAITREGIVVAKGTFNNLRQLEGLVGTAFERAAGAVHA